jgi:uncharacterized protein YycO
MKPGDYGLTNITGALGIAIGVGQALIGDGSRYEHAFICISDDEIVEAMPSGARRNSLSYYKDQPVVFSNLPLTNTQRTGIIDSATALIGTPYSFLDYLALAGKHHSIESKRLNNYIANKGHMICSQLVDECYRRAGVHLFSDGRLPQDVTPGDLTYVGNINFGAV